MNPLDLFIMGVCPGAGTIDYHSGRWYFDDLASLQRVLTQLGILRWWEREYCL